MVSVFFSRPGVILLSLAVVGLLAVGFVMLGSAGYYTAEGGDADYDLVRKQLWCFGFASLAAVGVAMVDYHRWLNWRWHLLILATVVLALCFVPGIGVKVNGAWRWIGFGGFRVQPSEFAKVALVMVLAAWYARYEPHTRNLVRGFVIPAGITCLLAGLIGVEMDLGGAAITMAVGLAIMFIAGAKVRYLPIIALAGIAVLAAMIWTTPNRLYRVIGFASDVPVISNYIDLSKLPADEVREIEAKKLQQQHAKLAFGSGGQDGTGPGMGRMKLYSLPEAHTDFIFAMVGEELGLNGTLWVVLCYLLLLIAGFHISMNAPDRFGRLLGFGLTFLLVIQGLVNMGVVTSVLPNKGLVLPLVSYGRSNLVMTMVCIGILCNIHRQGGQSRAGDLQLLRRKDRHTPQV
jgi:cell division protein FtsW